VAGDDAAALPGGGRLANNHWQWLITLSRYGRTSPGHDGGGARIRMAGLAAGQSRASATSFCDGSGRAGGQCRGGGAEWIDRCFADEEAEYLADFVSFQS
jgi:hypothetical protein